MSDKELELADKQDGFAMVGLPNEASLKALTAFCTGLIDTPFIPKSLQLKRPLDNASDDDWAYWRQKQAATMLAVCLTGRECGFSPMQALRAYWLSPDGRLGIYADSMQALMLKAGAKMEWDITDERTILTTKRGSNTYVSTWSVDDTKRAGIGGMHSKYPRAMHKARVLGDTYRTLFSDLGGSQMYAKEEIEAMEPEPDIPYRQAQEKEADKAAEADPGYSVEVGEKRKDTGPVDVTPEPLSTQEAQNEAFLKAAAKKKKAEEKAANEEARAKHAAMEKKESERAATTDTGVTDDDVPPVNADKPEPPPNPSEDKLRVEITSRTQKILDNARKVKDMPDIGRLQLLRFYMAWYDEKGDPKNISSWLEPVGSLEQEARAWGDDTYKELASKPDKLAIRLKKGKDKAAKSDPARGDVDKLAKAFPQWIAKEFGYAGTVIAKRRMSGVDDFLERTHAWKGLPDPGPELDACLVLWALDLNAPMLYLAAKKQGKTMLDAWKMVQAELGDKILSLETDPIAVTWAVGEATRKLNTPPKEEEKGLFDE